MPELPLRTGLPFVSPGRPGAMFHIASTVSPESCLNLGSLDDSVHVAPISELRLISGPQEDAVDRGVHLAVAGIENQVIDLRSTMARS